MQQCKAVFYYVLSCKQTLIYIYTMLDMIKIWDALKVMETGKVFSMTYVQHDTRRKKGGKKVEVLEARLCQAIPKSSTTKKAIHSPNKIPAEKNKKSPNHFKHKTRNYEVCIGGVGTGEKRKVKLMLITTFNGKKILL